MALTIQQQPSTPNQANADLLYVVTSDSSSKPQFQFVMELSDGASNTRTYKLRQQPNPSGKAVFNIGHMASEFLGIDTPFKTPNVQTSSLSGIELSTVFYEEYGTSTSSSVALYDGTSGSGGFYLLDGVVEPNSGDFNFASASYYTSSVTPTGGGADYGGLQHGLTNCPHTQSVRNDEYSTLSIINGNFDTSDTNAQDIYYIQVNVYNEAGSNIQNFGWYNIDDSTHNGGPRANSTQEWTNGGVYNTQDNGTRLIHIASGPKNFEDGGNTLNSNWASYKITIMGQESSGIEDEGAQYAQKWFTKSDGECGYTGTRFAFLNELGGYDYFSFDLADTKQDNITRETYEQPFVPYSTTTNSTPYDKSRRGSKVYSISYKETRGAESNYLTQEQADWLRELIESPEVYVQEGSDFLPVVVTNSNFTFKTNPRSQKLYTLNIQYELSNNRRSR